jgi:hypothetical protein
VRSPRASGRRWPCARGFAEAAKVLVGPSLHPACGNTSQLTGAIYYMSLRQARVLPSTKSGSDRHRVRRCRSGRLATAGAAVLNTLAFAGECDSLTSSDPRRRASSRAVNSRVRLLGQSNSAPRGIYLSPRVPSLRFARRRLSTAGAAASTLRGSYYFHHGVHVGSSQVTRSAMR